MLDLWEASVGDSPVRKGVALLAAIQPESCLDQLLALPIGVRDARLLDLHEQLFGDRIECTTLCTECGSTMEVEFDSSAIRVAPPTPGPVFTATADDITVTARPPNSGDLAAIEGMDDPDTAWRTLADRCIIAAERGDQALAPAEFSPALREAVEIAAGQADPQADIVLGLACPDCGAEAQVPFDIAHHVWSRLDHWGRAMLAAVDALAARYGWSESEILALAPSRRQHYLDLIVGIAR